MPISTKQTRAIGDGTRIGRPASAAIATASTEPETRPAGIPSLAKAMPPAAAISKRFDGRQDEIARGMASGIAADQCRVRAGASNDVGAQNPRS